jgi:nicotinate-nucleotide adenylyltransferase
VKVGLFGGSFNPIHYAHLIIAEWVRDALELDILYFLPTALPPHKKSNNSLINPEMRKKMVLLAIQDNPAFQLLDYETDSSHVSYSVDTVRRFLFENKSASGGQDHSISGKNVYFIIGEDNFRTIAAWKEPVELSALCRIVVVRRNTTVSLKLPVDMERPISLETPLIDISASEIRMRIFHGKSIRYLVPESVRQFIEENGLYKKR